VGNAGGAGRRASTGDSSTSVSTSQSPAAAGPGSAVLSPRVAAAEAAGAAGGGGDGGGGRGGLRRVGSGGHDNALPMHVNGVTYLMPLGGGMKPSHSCPEVGRLAQHAAATAAATAAAPPIWVGGLLRTSTRPTLSSLLLPLLRGV